MLSVPYSVWLSLYAARNVADYIQYTRRHSFRINLCLSQPTE